MRPRLPRYLSVALAACVLLSEAARAQVLPFGRNLGPGLSLRTTAAVQECGTAECGEPSRVGRSEAGSNPATQASGTSTILWVFRSGGMACQLVRHHIVVVGQARARDYRLTWCPTSTGEWKIKA